MAIKCSPEATVQKEIEEQAAKVNGHVQQIQLHLKGIVNFELDAT